MRSMMVVAVAASILVACDSSTAPVIPPQWAGDLQAYEGFEGVSGEVEIAAGSASFTAAIELDGLPDGTYNWEVASGTCEEPGNRVGAAAAYTALTPEDGAAAANVTVAGVLSSTASYHAAVFLPNGEERTEVACADVERVN